MTDLNPNRSPRNDELPPAIQLEGDTPDSQIWKASEITILQSHIRGYRGAGRKKKASYIVTVVIPQIKKAWNGRYARKELKKDRALQKEWDKKKKVNTSK